MNGIACKNGELSAGRVTVSLTRGETVVVIKNVPAQVCGNCGDYTLEADVAKQVYRQAEAAATHNAEVEILRYAA